MVTSILREWTYSLFFMYLNPAPQMCANNVSRVCCWEKTSGLLCTGCNTESEWIRELFSVPLNLYLTPAWWGIGCWEKECSVESSQAVLWPVCRNQCCYFALPGRARWSTLLKPGYRLWSWRWATFLYRTIISSCTVLALACAWLTFLYPVNSAFLWQTGELKF